VVGDRPITGTRPKWNTIGKEGTGKQLRLSGERRERIEGTSGVPEMVSSCSFRMENS